jgi:hypothetical protein
MPDRMSVPELTALIRASGTRMELLLAQLSVAEINQSGAVGVWSVKDVLAHLAAWEARLVQRVTGTPEDGAGMGTPQYNAWVYAANKDKSLAVVRAKFTRTHRAVLALAAGLTPSEREHWAAAFRLNTYNHYKWASALLRRWVKLSEVTRRKNC